jgi:hypothetical protein
MQKVKMVDYAYTDPRSFKNPLLRNQASFDDEKGVPAQVLAKNDRASKYVKKRPFDAIAALDFGSHKAVSQLAMVMRTVSALYSIGRLCGLVRS